MVDSTLLSHVLLKGKDWEKFAEYIPNSATLDLAITETLNAVINAKRKRIINEEIANKLLLALNEFSSSMRIYESKYYLARAFKVATLHNINIYSALYLALAEDLGYRLLSLDQRQIKIAGKLGIEIVKILNKDFTV